MRQSNTLLGPADLCLLLNTSDESGLNQRDVARLLGYRLSEIKIDRETPQPPLPDSSPNFPQPKPDNKTESHNPPLFQPDYHPKFWQIISLTSWQTATQTESVSIAPAAFSLAEIQTMKLPAPHYWSKARLQAAASLAANCQISLARQQVEYWLKALARAETPKAHPPELIEEESGEIWLVLDFHPDLMMLWLELQHIGQTLQRHFGKSRTRVVPVLADELASLTQSHHLPWPGQSTRTLLFSDLGWGQTRYLVWAEYLQQWQQQGAQVTLFWPGEPKAKLREKLPLSNVVNWDQPTKEQGQNEDLLACLSIVQWCSPALLRAWCKILDGNIHHQLQVWHSHKTWKQPDACGLEHEHIALYREKFSRFETSLQHTLLAALYRYRPQASNAVLFEEALIHESLHLSVPESSKQIVTQQMATLSTQAASNSAVQAWLYRLSNRQCAGFWRAHPTLQQLCASSNQQWLNEQGYREDESATRVEQLQLRLYLLGEQLQLSEKPLAVGCELLSIYSDQPSIQYQFDKPAAELWQVGSALALNNQQLTHIKLDSGLQQAELKQITKPDWATSIEQGPEGLYCTLPDDRRLRWCYPQERTQGLFHPLTAPDNTVKATWVDEQQWQLMQQSTLPYLPEGTAWGQDDYGVYADLQIEKLIRRFRWIPPGEFLMGSPDNEPERREDEHQHDVMLTQGFWLAETACDQALWQMLMRENPSRFQRDDLPVESVSWEMVEQFCLRLSKYLTGVRLPTEAEWEYACRAGTQTVFWWGNELNTERANYNGNYPYHKGPKGENRKKTLPVKSFEENPWGLYQMHGNVEEWCADRYGDYPLERVAIDPLGADTGDHRVFRGGSWNYDGRWLRAADRDRGTPGGRNDDLGFRLALGPRPGVAAAAGEAVGPAWGARGAGERSRDKW